MFKYSARVLSLILIVISLSSASVYATWKLSMDPAYSVDNVISTGIIEFEYKPEEILPGDKESTELHQNHYNLINSIVNHVDYGLNAKKKPIIREMLEDGAGLVYSNQSVSGGNLKHMLLNTSDVEALMFVVEYVSDTEYVAYTFSQNDVGSQNVGNCITVYKTVLQKKNVKWEATFSYQGIAKVFRPEIVNYSIDVKTWEHT